MRRVGGGGGRGGAGGGARKRQPPRPPQQSSAAARGGGRASPTTAMEMMPPPQPRTDRKRKKGGAAAGSDKKAQPQQQPQQKQQAGTGPGQAKRHKDAAARPESPARLPQALQPLGNASPSRILAALEHDHPMAGRELIARACIDLIRTGRFHHPSVVASLHCIEQYRRVCRADASRGLGDRLRDVLAFQQQFHAQELANQMGGGGGGGGAVGGPASPGAAILQLFDSVFNSGSGSGAAPTTKGKARRPAVRPSPLRPAGWPPGLMVPPPQTQPLGPHLRAQRTEELGVQDAMFSLVWVRRGALEAKCSSAFARVFMTTEELAGRIRDQRLLVPYIWGSTMIAREDLPEFYRAVAGVLYGQAEVADSSLVARCISRTGQSVLSLVRIFGGHNFQTGLGAIVLSVTPLPQSRYLRVVRRQEHLFEDDLHAVLSDADAYHEAKRPGYFLHAGDEEGRAAVLAADDGAYSGAGGAGGGGGEGMGADPAGGEAMGIVAAVAETEVNDDDDDDDPLMPASLLPTTGLDPWAGAAASETSAFSPVRGRGGGLLAHPHPHVPLLQEPPQLVSRDEAMAVEAAPVPAPAVPAAVSTAAAAVVAMPGGVASPGAAFLAPELDGGVLVDDPALLEELLFDDELEAPAPAPVAAPSSVGAGVAPATLPAPPAGMAMMPPAHYHDDAGPTFSLAEIAFPRPPPQPMLLQQPQHAHAHAHPQQHSEAVAAAMGLPRPVPFVTMGGPPPASHDWPWAVAGGGGQQQQQRGGFVQQQYQHQHQPRPFRHGGPLPGVGQQLQQQEQQEMEDKDAFMAHMQTEG